MGYFQALLKDPGPHTPLSRYTFYNGVLYLAYGLGLYAWPGQLQLGGFPPFVSSEEGLVRVSGALSAVIGWFYIWGSRTRSEVFGLSTVADRLLLPFFFLPLGWVGAIPMPYALLLSAVDPVLGLGAYVIWRRSRSAAPS